MVPKERLLFAQPLMRSIDVTKVTPEVIIDDAVAWGVDALIVNGGGFLCWYPSALSSQKTNPYMTGDFLGDVVCKAHQRRIEVFCRMDISKGYDEWLVQRPDWFARRADGSPVQTWDLYETHFTGAYWQEENFKILEEILRRYDVDGFFYNYFRIAPCSCTDCASLADPAQSLAAYTRRVKKHIGEKTLICYHHLRQGWDEAAMASAMDLVSYQASNPLSVNPIDPQPRWTYWSAEEAMYGRALKPHQAPVLVHSLSSMFASRQMSQPGPRLAHDIMQSAMYGATPCPSANGGLKPEDARPCAEIEETLGFIKAHRELFRPEGAVRPPIALCRHRTPELRDEFRGLFALLTDLRLPFEVVVGDDISGYQVVVHPGAPPKTMKHEGVLLVTADDRGTETSVTGGYFQIHSPVLKDLVGAPYVGVEGRFWKSSSKSEAPLDLQLVGPFTNNAPEFAFWDEQALRPAFGLIGTSFPWELGRLYLEKGIPEYRTLVAGLLSGVDSWVHTDAPLAVQIRAVRLSEATLVYILNNATAQEHPFTEWTPLGPFNVEVPGAVQVCCAPGGDRQTGSRYTFSHLVKYAVLRFEHGPNAELGLDQRGVVVDSHAAIPTASAPEARSGPIG